MKKAGIVGGMEPESTIDYYQSIISKFQEKLTCKAASYKEIRKTNQPIMHASPYKADASNWEKVFSLIKQESVQFYLAVTYMLIRL